MEKNIKRRVFYSPFLFFWHDICIFARNKRNFNMSVNIGEIIEVKNNGRWELLENFYDGSNIHTEADGVIPEDYIVYNAKERSTGVEKVIASDVHNLIFDDFYRDFLLEESGFETDLGLPDDISKEAKEVYESIDNKSEASYFYLYEFYKRYSKAYDDFTEMLNSAIDAEMDNDVNRKLDWLIEYCKNHNVKKFNNKEGKKDYRYSIMLALKNLMSIHTHCMRLSTIVEKCAPNLDFWEPNNVRVIWFVR